MKYICIKKLAYKRMLRDRLEAIEKRMTREQQEKHFDEMVLKMRDILLSKGNDYANTDRLSNFKLAGNISGLNAKLNCLSLISTKVARLGVLLNSDKAPSNESVKDSVLDLANYAVLLDMILSDEDGQLVKTNI